MSPVTTTIIEKLQELSPEQQQVVLELIELLETGAWEALYQGRLDELRGEIQIGMAAAARGEVVPGDVVFEQLREKLRQRRAVVEG